MSYLQILTGPRGDEVIELNSTATLIVGSAPDAHIQLPDSDVTPNHCQVYPAQGSFWLQDLGQGSTVLNMRRLTGEIEGLKPLDVIIVGRTFLRFLAQAPAAASGSGSHTGAAVGGGEDSAALAAAQSEIAALKEEVDQLRNWHSKGEALSSTLTEKLREAKDRLEKVRRQLSERDDEIHELRQERARMEKRLVEVQKDLANSEEKSKGISGEVAKLKAALQTHESELETTRKGRETARVDAKRLQVELGILESQAKQELQNTKSAAENRVTELEETLVTVRQTLEASRQALEALGVQRPADESPLESSGPGLAETLDALDVPHDQRRRLEDALTARIDSEALRRFSGPLLTWDRPIEAAKLEADLRALRTRTEKVDLALSMGVDPT